jgi:hypothetical protein
MLHPYMVHYTNQNNKPNTMVEVSVLSGFLTSVWSASFGLLARLDFGPCPLILSLFLSSVLSFYDVWKSFIIKYNTYIPLIQ